MYLNASGLKQVDAPSIANCFKQSCYDSVYAQNIVTFREDTVRNCFEAKSWVRTIHLAFNKMAWKEAVTKTFMNMAVRWIVTAESERRANID